MLLQLKHEVGEEITSNGIVREKGIGRLGPRARKPLQRTGVPHETGDEDGGEIVVEEL